MDPSDIKDCGRNAVHQGHHWYEPIKRPPLAAYGGDWTAEYETPDTKLWYCRGDSGTRQYRVRIVIEPEPGTPGPFGGKEYEVRTKVGAELMAADVAAEADSHQTVLAHLLREAAQYAAHGYHEALMKQAAEVAGRPYLDEPARAQKRLAEREAQYREEDRRQLLEAAFRPPLPVYDPALDGPGGTSGYTMRMCAYCGRDIVRIEPTPGYSEWTTDVRTTAGQECPPGPNRLHAPLARPVSGPQDTAY